MLSIVCNKNFVRIFLLAGWLAITSGQALAEANYYRYAGVEYYGSSQMTSLELQKYLGLKPGATLRSTDQALLRLQKKLEESHINGQAHVIVVPPNQLYIVVDVTDSMTDISAPTCHLKNPHHVLLRTEQPFILMNQLEQRLEKLNAEGRPWHEEIKEGLKYYSDEPANQIVAEILKQAPDMRQEILAVIDSDPDPNRRRRAVELLNWTGAVPDTCLRLIPSIDDADSGVRAAIARYMLPRFDTLPDNFPFQELVEAYSRMLSRPSHQDRTKSLYCLLSLANQFKNQNPNIVRGIQIFDEDRIKKLAELSVIPAVKEPANKLLELFAKLPKTEPINTQSGKTQQQLETHQLQKKQEESYF